jgi:hypothetical protein
MSALHIDMLRTLSLQFKDSQGHLVSGVTPDSMPQWAFTDPTSIQSSVSADGLTVAETPLKTPGQSDATVTVVVGGVTFTATDQQPVIAGNIASVAIVETDVANPNPQPAPAGQLRRR